MIICEKQIGANPPGRDHTTRDTTQEKRRSNVHLELQLGKNKPIFEVRNILTPLVPSRYQASKYALIRSLNNKGF